MPLQYVDAPGVKTHFEEGDAKILQLNSEKEFRSNHTLRLSVYRTSLRSGCHLSSKLLPIVLRMIERKDDYQWSDFYSFDHNGKLLSHGYSRTDLKTKKCEVDEAHDLSLDRLLEHGENIREMIRDYPLPFGLSSLYVLNDLRENLIG